MLFISCFICILDRSRLDIVHDDRCCCGIQVRKHNEKMIKKIKNKMNKITLSTALKGTRY